MSDTVDMKKTMEALSALHETVEKYGQKSSDALEMIEKTDEAFKALDEQNQKTVQEMSEERKKNEDNLKRIETLEVQLSQASKNNPGEDYKKMPEFKALEAYMRKGDGQIDLEQKQLLRTDSDTAGGYLTTTEMDDMIIRQITEISPVRSVARVKTVGKKTLEIPTRTSIPVAQYEGEAATAPESTSTYGSESLTAYRQTVTIPFTMDMMLDSNFDIEAEIMQDVSEAFAFGEGNAFVNGSGAKQPEGFLSTAAGLQTDASVSGTSGSIDGDDLIALSGELKVGYQPYYAFNRRSLAAFRQLKGSDGQYLWQIGLGGGAPNTIAGMPYILFEDMPDIAANSYSVAYADFMRGYCVTDRTGMTVIRDIYTQKGQNIIELTFSKYNTGQVVLPEAFKLLRTAA